jgi:hypothetical protein
MGKAGFLFWEIVRTRVEAKGVVEDNHPVEVMCRMKDNPRLHLGLLKSQVGNSERFRHGMVLLVIGKIVVALNKLKGNRTFEIRSRCHENDLRRKPL